MFTLFNCFFQMSCSNKRFFSITNYFLKKIFLHRFSTKVTLCKYKIYYNNHPFIMKKHKKSAYFIHLPYINDAERCSCVIDTYYLGSMRHLNLFCSMKLFFYTSIDFELEGIFASYS